jgi:hypothetical protein
VSVEKHNFLGKHNHEMAWALFAVSLCGTMWESGYLMTSRPVQPDYAAGLIYPFQVKGPITYISASDANCVSLCWLFAILGFGCMAYIIGPRSTVGSSPSHGSPGIGVGFLISIVVVAGSFLLFGRCLGDFLSAHGVVLHFYSSGLPLMRRPT